MCIMHWQVHWALRSIVYHYGNNSDDHDHDHDHDHQAQADTRDGVRTYTQPD